QNAARRTQHATRRTQHVERRTLFGARYVVAGAGAHLRNLLHQIVEGFVAGVGVELGGFDDQQGRGVVVEEKMRVSLVERLQVLRIRKESVRLRVLATRVESAQEDI